MTRLFACLAAAAVLAGCGLAAAPQKSDAAVLVGVGDQDASMFTDPLFTQIGFKRARYFPSWNVAQKAAGGRLARPVARPARRPPESEPLISFFAALGSACPKRPCKLPTVRQYTKAFKAFRKRWPQVKVVNPWNEANHRSQPTFKNPKRAAQFYNVVRANCRGCKIVAADVIDEVNMERWLKVFKRTAKKPRIWGLHNYRDTNKRKGQRLGGTKRLLKSVKGEVWLTETGGIVKFVLPERAHAVPAVGEPRELRDEADVRAREALPEPHQAAVHLPLEAVRRRTTASTPGWCARTARRGRRTRTVRNQLRTRTFNP